MDRKQKEMQFLGLLDIYIDSCKVIFSWRKIFSKITLALILPLSFIVLGHMEASDLLFKDIAHHQTQLAETRAGSPKYQKLSDIVNKELAYALLFKLAYLIFYVGFSLLSTAAVVYAIACIYTSGEVTFRKVMSVVPKVWNRLMNTVLSMFVFIFLYHMVFAVVFFSWIVLVAGPGDGLAFVGFSVLFGLSYFLGLFYLRITWQLAGVVSVLEDACGFKAMDKSRALIKGKMWLNTAISFMLSLSFVAINAAFNLRVVHGTSFGTLYRVCFGIICFLLLSMLFLFELVVKTITYLVCKSHHHENIDKSALSNHLEVYSGEYAPLKSKDVQLDGSNHV